VSLNRVKIVAKPPPLDRQSRGEYLTVCDASLIDASQTVSIEEDRRQMGTQRRGDPEELLPLTPVALNILLALADEERHGYGIGVEVRERTGGKMRLGPGTLYGSIRRMVDGGLVAESEGPADEETDDGCRRYDAERRRYYRLTGFGEQVLAAELTRLEEVVRTAQAKGVSPTSGRGVSSPGEA
jgi:DNA-binding PadR family transcriptional regulator